MTLLLPKPDSMVMVNQCLDSSLDKIIAHTDIDWPSPYSLVGGDVN